MTEKNKVQANILEYQRRRDKVRALYPDWRTNSEYAARVWPLTKKIAHWRRKVRRIEAREERIWAINDKVCAFMDLRSLRLSTGKEQRHFQLARLIFCKYAIESGIPGGLLTDFLGCAKRTPARARLRFTRSFKTNKANYSIWIKFKQYATEGHKMAA